MSEGPSPPLDESIQPACEDEDLEDADGFSIEAGSPSFERRLSRREKVRRGGLGVLVVLVTAFFLLGGPSSALSWLGSLRASVNNSTPSSGTPSISAPAILGNVLATEVMPPPGASNNLTLKLEPANGPDGYIYSCWSDQQAEKAGLSNRLHVGLYTRVSGDWTELTAPASAAANCAIVPDREREFGVLLAVWPAAPPTYNICLLPRLFHSDDSGQVWRAIPWPREVQQTCDPEFFLDASRLYVQSATPLLPASELLPSSASGFLLTTDTDVVSWRPADAGQANDSAFQLIALRPQGRLLAESLQGHAKCYQAGLLWQSVDSGQHWKVLAALPGNAPTVSVSSDPAATDHGGWGYVYVTYFTGGMAPKPALSYGVLDTQGANWVSLPLPDSAGTPQGGPMVGYLPDGAEGPLESLVYLLPGGSTSRSQSPLYLPWLWDTVSKTWKSAPVNLPINSIPQGVSWQNGVMTILVSVIAQGVLPLLVTFSLTFSPRQLTASQWPAWPANRVQK
ncbi:MAG: hypothetical protein ACLQUY_16385 [Ktedonobacterales bacterium]